jgi:thioesterase domain-containing protein
MRIYPVRENGLNTRLFCCTPDNIEGLPFRRLAKHLQGQMDLAIVRPANTWYSHSLFTFERAGEDVATLIRQMQPRGPYFLCGHCSGGVVAVEAARELSRHGMEVRVILIETLLPGFPEFLRDWRIWMDAMVRQWKQICISEHPGLRGNLERFKQHFLWFAASVLRRPFVPIENAPAFRRLMTRIEGNGYPVYQARYLDVACLHILSTDEPSTLPTLGAASRFGWRAYVRRGIKEAYVPYDHHNVLHESNLPRIAKLISTWIGIEQISSPDDH